MGRQRGGHGVFMQTRNEQPPNKGLPSILLSNNYLPGIILSVGVSSSEENR